jgi:hypothetical protein
MTDSDENVIRPDMDHHPWGGTVIRTNINDKTYKEAISERFAWDVLDFSNAIAMYILDGLAERVSETANWLVSETADTSFNTNNEAVSKFFLINTFSSAIFESASYLLFTQPLCYAESQTGVSIIEYFDSGGERAYYKIKEASNRKNKSIEAIKRIREAIKPNQYFELLSEFMGVKQELLSQISELYTKRGDIVHNLMGLIEMDWKTVKTTAELWNSCILEFLNIIEDRLVIHQGLYQGLSN